MTKKSESNSLGEKVYQILRERILSLEYPPEAVLVEKDLCAELKVSRPPLKAAILRLEEMDLVRTVPRFGTVVSHIDANEIAHVYEVKLDLEALACSLAALRITEEQVQELELLAAELERVAKEHEDLRNEKSRMESFKEITELDIKLHCAIWQAAHNPVLEKVLNNLHSRCLRFCRATVPLSGWNLGHVNQFSKICEAFRKRDRESAVDYIRLHNRQYLRLIRDSTFSANS
ncbi:MAG: GntR family transcriptional regulator [Desulfarculaceae bacterium]|nr:GntR family transcriptional regulator [Desulfarculaceae bacterium]MCF8071186.1 GntR family transcriptional regulator [Desulfarculaceae bacterium]MCF8101211.1 GntR family transcriptional regulator [Desulfarculaceae bacterium]MCF8115240.1 GntR family transcriptional regulator [Desulfarculaceae bacterium]